ncbi:MAG TPA: hypothetical protein VFK02_23970 [Kofleriaceae bacterium]|nr:hypothetical protein [Kofleriaceae bacterium]
MGIVRLTQDQLLGIWIDEAILLSTLPEYWSALEREGITGALDLVDLTHPYRHGESPESLEDQRRRTSYFGALCARAGEADTTSYRQGLEGVMTRLATDAQIRLLRVLDEHIGAHDRHHARHAG